MRNARPGRLALLGAAASMLAMPFALAAAPAGAAPARHAAPPTPEDGQGHGWIGSSPVVGPLTPQDGQGHGWMGRAPGVSGFTAHEESVSESPTAYAQATFDAWVRVDRIELEKRGTPAVADMLEARPWSWDDEWDEQKDCEGAAGSTYCTWTGRSAQLTLRVANEQASSGEPHAVIEAVLDPIPGQTVALWPYTTQKEADNSQKQVDEGHSPWQLYPDTVAMLYAQAELGWNDPDVEPEGDDTYRITDAGTEAQVEVTMGQPSRVGDGGIWAVTSLRSAPGS